MAYITYNGRYRRLYSISLLGLWGEFDGGRHERLSGDRASLFRPNPTANLVSANEERRTLGIASSAIIRKEPGKESSCNSFTASFVFQGNKAEPAGILLYNRVWDSCADRRSMTEGEANDAFRYKLNIVSSSNDMQS